MNVKLLQLYHLFDILDKTLPHNCVCLFVDTIICNMLLALYRNKTKTVSFSFLNKRLDRYYLITRNKFHSRTSKYTAGVSDPATSGNIMQQIIERTHLQNGYKQKEYQLFASSYNKQNHKIDQVKYHMTSIYANERILDLLVLSLLSFT